MEKDKWLISKRPIPFFVLYTKLKRVSVLDQNLLDKLKEYYEKTEDGFDFFRCPLHPDCYILRYENYFFDLTTKRCLTLSSLKMIFQVNSFPLPQEFQLITKGNKIYAKFTLKDNITFEIPYEIFLSNLEKANFWTSTRLKKPLKMFFNYKTWEMFKIECFKHFEIKPIFPQTLIELLRVVLDPAESFVIRAFKVEEFKWQQFEAFRRLFWVYYDDSHLYIPEIVLFGLSNLRLFKPYKEFLTDPTYQEQLMETLGFEKTIQNNITVWKRPYKLQYVEIEEKKPKEIKEQTEEKVIELIDYDTARVKELLEQYGILYRQDKEKAWDELVEILRLEKHYSLAFEKKARRIFDELWEKRPKGQRSN